MQLFKIGYKQRMEKKEIFQRALKSVRDNQKFEVTSTAQKFPEDLVTFTEEILNGKLHFLYSGDSRYRVVVCLR